MKRDWELIRQILIKLEELPEQEGRLMPGEVEGYDWQVVSYHIKLLHEAGLIEASAVRALGVEPLYYAKTLTWLGHEVLDSIRKASFWNKIKERIRQRGLDMTMDILKDVAREVAKEILR